MLGSCVACQKETDKYKCPNCLGPYCSLACYKEHKNHQECQTTAASDDPSTIVDPLKDDILQEPTIHMPFTTEDTVPREKLELLRNSESLQNLLYNPHLRSLLHEMDVAPNAWKAMRAAMQEPLFIEFADECLKIIEPMTEEEAREMALLRNG